jgi:hypothetical protein
VPDRDVIKGKLRKELDDLVGYYGALSDDDLRRLCTESEVEGAPGWTAKDHIAHLAMIERAFQGMIRRGLAGDANPVGLGGGDREHVMARVHRGNQDNVDAHRGDDVDTLFADLQAARGETLALLDELSDEDLGRRLPGAPWADGTIGGVLITNAYHQRQHVGWVSEGLGGAAPPDQGRVSRKSSGAR